MEKNQNCNKFKGLKKTKCIVKKGLCNQTAHNIAAAGGKLYAISNPASAGVVILGETAMGIGKEFLCERKNKKGLRD